MVVVVRRRRRRMQISALVAVLCRANKSKMHPVFKEPKKKTAQVWSISFYTQIPPVKQLRASNIEGSMLLSTVDSFGSCLSALI